MNWKTIIAVGWAILITCSAYAKTPDDKTPAEEDVCEQESGAAYGLCNAYCEAMDCDSENSLAAEVACLKVEEKWIRITGREFLPCDLAGVCTDADGDGWGASGFDQTGCPNSGDDCNDTFGNTDDADGDNVCINVGVYSDNCPNVFNPSQTDADNDNIGNVCDSCTDADGDGWGASGFDQTGCPNSGDDCNDTFGNTDDDDGDNVCI